MSSDITRCRTLRYAAKWTLTSTTTRLTTGRHLKRRSAPLRMIFGAAECQIHTSLTAAGATSMTSPSSFGTSTRPLLPAEGMLPEGSVRRRSALHPMLAGDCRDRYQTSLLSYETDVVPFISLGTGSCITAFNCFICG